MKGNLEVKDHFPDIRKMIHIVRLNTMEVQKYDVISMARGIIFLLDKVFEN